MADTFKPQFPIEQLHSLPFTEERFYLENGEVEYRPLEGQKVHTGIDFLDAFIGWCSRYPFSYVLSFSSAYGFNSYEICAFIKVLTGLTAREFCTRYKLRLVDDYLRYTNLPGSEIIKKCGIEKLTSLSRSMKTYYKTTYSSRRQALRQKHDVGRYR